MRFTEAKNFPKKVGRTHGRNLDPFWWNFSPWLKFFEAEICKQKNKFSKYVSCLFWNMSFTFLALTCRFFQIQRISISDIIQSVIPLSKNVRAKGYVERRNSKHERVSVQKGFWQCAHGPGSWHKSILVQVSMCPFQ